MNGSLVKYKEGSTMAVRFSTKHEMVEKLRKQIETKDSTAIKVL